MMRWLGPLAVLIVTALGAHWATLAYAPSVIMDRALQTLKDRGIAEHAFTTPQRITPQTQVVVRSSPDLFYSLCRFDFGGGVEAVRLEMAAWPDYQSLSFFDAETNNFATIRKPGAGVETFLLAPSLPNEAGYPQSPTTRGVILIRRLAPTQSQFEQAKAASRDDRCEALTFFETVSDRSGQTQD
ncbi:MAG: DUF1254 domain-containing protein [Pseudomonadota bacterium]